VPRFSSARVLKSRPAACTQRAIQGTWPSAGQPVIADATTKAMLDSVDEHLRTVVRQTQGHQMKKARREAGLSMLQEETIRTATAGTA
jgi:hypothetical protein